eukprot:CFRG7187T1
MAIVTQLKRRGITSRRGVFGLLALVVLYLVVSPSEHATSDVNDYHTQGNVVDEIYRPVFPSKKYQGSSSDTNHGDLQGRDKGNIIITENGGAGNSLSRDNLLKGVHEVESFEAVHVVFAFGRDYIVPAFVSVNSTLTNSKNPERLVLHLLVEEAIVSRVEKAFKKAFGHIADVTQVIGETSPGAKGVGGGAGVAGADNEGRNIGLGQKDGSGNEPVDPLDAWDDGENVDNGGFIDRGLNAASVDESDEQEANVHTRRAAVPNRPVIEVVPFDVSTIPKVKVWQGPQNLLNPLNYARFQLPQIFPTLRKVLYIDPDVVVQGDLCIMWDSFLISDKYVIAAASSPGEKYSKFILDYNIAQVDKNTDYFNAGVMVINLRLWKERNKDKQILTWLALNRESPVYKYGSQPPLMLTFYKDYENMGMIWNFRHLGHKQTLKASDIQRANIIHYNGPRKPWRSNGIEKYRKYWSKYYNPTHEVQSMLVWGFEEIQDLYLSSGHQTCITRPLCRAEANRMGVQPSWVHFDAEPNKQKYLPAMLDFFGDMWKLKQAKFLFQSEYRWRFLWVRKQSDLATRLKKTKFDFAKVDGKAQIINFIPGVFEESYHKNQLCRNSQRFVEKHGADVAASGFLKCFILPEQHAALLDASSTEPEKVWIGKMFAESSGKGIELYAGLNALPPPTALEKRVVQEYVEKPFLVDVLNGKRKTDIRIYAVITSLDPVRIYLHTAGQVKVAQSVYSSNFTNMFAHISNAVGSAEDPYDLRNKTLRVERQIDEFKWRLTLDELQDLVEPELFRDAWGKVEELIVRSVLSFADRLGCKSPKYPYPCGSAYQLLGVDVVFDAEMTPHLMEVNNDPGWNPYYEKRKYTVATKGGTANGAKCHFPFTFRGKKVLECIPKSQADPKLWCYTDDQNSRWGYCDTESEEAHSKDSLQKVFNAVYGDLLFLTGVVPYDVEFENSVIDRYDILCAGAQMPAECRIDEVKDQVVAMANEMQGSGDFRMVFPIPGWKEKYGSYLQAHTNDPASVGHTTDNELMALDIFSNFFSYDFQDAVLYRKKKN